MSGSLEETFINELLSDLESDKLVLPTLPEVALRVRNTLEDENASLMNVAKVVTSDVALSARLIQVANSPLLRASRKIETVESAVTRMGGNMVRNMVTSIAMEQMFQATTDVTDKRLRQIWEHSTQVAAICTTLAKMHRGLQPDQALLAGLVHDIGALPILSRAEDVPELIDDEELLDCIIATTHTKIGAAILVKWNFPSNLVAVASEHENLKYNEADGPDYVDLVIVANLQTIIGKDHPYTKEDWSSIPAFGRLGLVPELGVIDLDEAEEDIAAVQMALTG